MQSNGEITASDGRCVDIYNFSGPVVQTYHCNGGTNEDFSISTSGVIADKSGHCLAYKSTSPSGSGSGTILQLWAKPQPQGAMAVLVLNSDATTAQNHTVTIDFKSLNLTDASYNVRSIWDHADLPAASGSFVTDPIPGHDSRFYLLSPK